MPGVAEVDAGLVGALVAAHLQADGALAGVELLIGELTRVLLGLLRAQAGLAEVGRLKKAKIVSMMQSINALRGVNGKCSARRYNSRNFGRTSRNLH